MKQLTSSYDTYRDICAVAYMHVVKTDMTSIKRFQQRDDYQEAICKGLGPCHERIRTLTYKNGSISGQITTKTA